MSTVEPATVLVVDDNPVNLSVISDCLHEAGYRVLTALKGSDALDRAAMARPDIIILDVMMPDLDGFEVCRRLKADLTTQTIPVIFMTALTNLEDKLKGFQVGGVDYITKPFQREEVTVRVNTHLQIQRLTRNLQMQNSALQQEIREREQIQAELRETQQVLEQRVVERTHETLRRAEDLSILMQVSSALRQADTSADIITTLMDVLRQSLWSEGCAILKLGQNRLTIVDGYGLAADLADASTPILQQVVNDGEPRFYTGLPADVQPLFGATSAGGLALVPLQTGQIPLGLLVYTGASDERKTRLLSSIAEITANALQRADVLETLEQRVADRTRELNVLYRVTTIASETLDLPVMLLRALAEVLKAVHSQTGAIHFHNEMQLHLAAQSGFTAEVAATLEVTPLADQDIWHWVTTYNGPLIIRHPARDERIPLAFRVPGLMVYLGVPINVKGEAIGILSIFGDTAQQFNAEDVALLTTVTDQLGVAIENSRLRQQARQSVIVEERQRLARELHDAVTQSLYSVALFSEAGRKQAEANNIDRAMHYLQRVGDVAQQALKEMRLLIYELRPSALESEGLVNALRRRLESVEQRAGVETQFVVSGELQLQPDVEQELYRIAQEALNNALKHAGATMLNVAFQIEGRAVILTISDNGHGFDHKTVQGGMGLVSIKERVLKLGGSLDIQSSETTGTQITVRLTQQQAGYTSWR